MATGDNASITLSAEIVGRLESRRDRGSYANVEDVIRDALDTTESETERFEAWLVEEATPALAEFHRDPSTARTSEQVQQAIQAEYESLVRAR